MSVPSMTCSFGSNDSPCGSVGNNSTILPLNSCDNDMTSYLASLGVSIKRSIEQQSTLSEISFLIVRVAMTMPMTYGQ